MGVLELHGLVQVSNHDGGIAFSILEYCGTLCSYYEIPADGSKA